MRCFVACCPDEATRARLDEIGRAAAARFPGARRIRAENLHLTLAFIGELAEPAAREVTATLHHALEEFFEWRLDHIGCFERARVLWAGGPEEDRLSALADRVRDRLRRLSVRFDAKRFAAHVTLLRDLPARPRAHADGILEAIDPLVWPIRSVSLQVSERDAQGATRYRGFEPS